jgi:hypothetical protein
MSMAGAAMTEFKKGRTERKRMVECRVVAKW